MRSLPQYGFLQIEHLKLPGEKRKGKKKKKKEKKKRKNERKKRKQTERSVGISAQSRIQLTWLFSLAGRTPYSGCTAYKCHIGLRISWGGRRRKGGLQQPYECACWGDRQTETLTDSKIVRVLLLPQRGT